MKLHPRERIVTQARLKLAKAVLDMIEEFELTDHELVKVVMEECSSTIQSHAKYGIRFERHGNYEDEGGLEK
jgi:hypothetical protein